MNIKKSVNGDSALFEIDGWLDTQSAPMLEQELAALEPNVKQLTIDMSGLQYISSAGLRQIVSAHKKMSGALTLTNLSVEIMDVFKMAGFDKKLNIL